jgi:hypothetical protein
MSATRKIAKQAAEMERRALDWWTEFQADKALLFLLRHLCFVW